MFLLMALIGRTVQTLKIGTIANTAESSASPQRISSRVQGFKGSSLPAGRQGFKVLSAGKELQMLKNFKELKVWQKAYQLCLEIYRVTRNFPREEIYGLTSQIRRAAVSVPSNIAEGYGRKNKGEYIQALYIAYGSNCELETQVMLSGDLGYVEDRDLRRLLEGVGDIERMLKALIKSLGEKT